jgi:formylglycine-generating enzyme required for sulfatase activity
MKKYSALLLTLLLSSCSSEMVKNPEMLSLSNITVSYIRGEAFVMGSYNDPFLDKSPRSVRVSDFYIDKTEVTNAAYAQYLIEAGESVRKPDYITDLVLGAPTLPVVSVTYQEAVDFCEFYNKRLPTEAEWEFAAKGGTKFQDYFWGDDENPLYLNSRASKKEHAVAVASYPPNRYGLYDMHGNVREWVVDYYEKDFYKYACSPLSTDNNCYRNPVNEEPSRYRSNRGGSYSYSEGYPATVSFRFFDRIGSKHKDVGFRCAASDKDDWLFLDRSKFENQNFERPEEGQCIQELEVPKMKIITPSFKGLSFE